MTLSTLSSNLDANHKLVNDAKPPDSKQMTHANPINSNYISRLCFRIYRPGQLNLHYSSFRRPTLLASPTPIFEI